jgi:hypothetical protein
MGSRFRSILSHWRAILLELHACGTPSLVLHRARRGERPRNVAGPSVVAPASNTARMIRDGGGFVAEADAPLMDPKPAALLGDWPSGSAFGVRTPPQRLHREPSSAIAVTAAVCPCHHAPRLALRAIG